MLIFDNKIHLFTPNLDIFRASLLSSNTSGFGQDTWGMESEETKGMSIDDIRQQQQQLIKGRIMLVKSKFFVWSKNVLWVTPPKMALVFFFWHCVQQGFFSPLRPDCGHVLPHIMVWRRSRTVVLFSAQDGAWATCLEARHALYALCYEYYWGLSL